MRSLVLALAIAASPVAAASLTGVNLAGAEFGGLRGVYGKAYIYPNANEMAAFAKLGANVFRLPVRWERLQPVAGGALDPAEMRRLDTAIGLAGGVGVNVVIDIHNYARFAGKTIGKPGGPPSAAFADLWSRLAARYRHNPKVVFGLMNEPVKIGALEWAAIAAEAVSAIRRTGATNLVLVPGTAWTGAHSWRRNVGNASNAEALAGFRDPANNFAFEFHQYFDGNSSGTSAACVTPEEAVRRLAVATDWLREVGGRGFLGEFGVSAAPECQPVLKAALAHMAANPEWLGWTAWASSAWFGNYPFNLYPLQTPAPPQLMTMKPFLAR